MKKILVINPFGIGDVLFTTPLVSNLRHAYPNAHIAFMGNRRTSDFLRHNLKINQVFAYERDEFYAVYQRNPIAFAGKWLDFARQIREERFDVTFDFSMNSTFGFLAMACGIPIRIGYNFRGRGRFLTHQLPLSGYEGQHVADYYLDLLKWMDIPIVCREMEMPLPSEDIAWASQWLKDQGINEKKCIAVIPGGGASWGNAAKNKRWPASEYAQLVDKIIADSKGTVILMGDASESTLAQEVICKVHGPVYSAVGKTSLTQMAALLKLCRLAIVNDGGPLHIAVASGVPTFSIFGPVDEVVYGPWPRNGHEVVKKNLACQPCYQRFRMAHCAHHSCLQNLSVDEVYKKLERLL